MSPLAQYAQSAELMGRRVAHIVNTTAGVSDAATMANNAGRAALRKAVSIRTAAREAGIEIIPLDDVILALTVAINEAERAADRAFLEDYREAAARQVAA